MELKKEIRVLLEAKRFDEILNLVDRPSKLIRILMSTLYDENHITRYGAAYVLGLVNHKIYSDDPEKVNQILHKLLWSLNDESGFVCWGAPEAIGEIVRNIPELVPTYAQFLISFLSHPQVVLDNRELDKGILIALARIGNIEAHLKEQLFPILEKYIEENNDEIKGLALWCGFKLGFHKVTELEAKFFKNITTVSIYENGIKVVKPLSDFS